MRSRRMRVGDQGSLLPWRSSVSEPLFKVGDLVRVQGNISLGPGEVALDAYEVTSTIGMAPGVFEVTAILPEEGGYRQYRIKGGEHAQERVAREAQIARAPTFAANPSFLSV
jgi:hypothetical protein